MWVALNNGQIASWGENGCPKGFFDEVIEYESWPDAEKAHPRLANDRRGAIVNEELAKINIGHDIQAAHAIKAFEALSYTYLNMPESACNYCKAYAKKHGVSFDEAVRRVLKKLTAPASKEADRTLEREKIRKT